MNLFKIKTKLIPPRSDLTTIVLKAINSQKLKVEDYDVLALASKAVSISEDRVRNLASVKPSEKAEKIASRFGLDPRFVESVLLEADQVIWGVPKALLTQKNNILIPNAGVDRKNSPKGYVTLWPTNPDRAAEKIRDEILRRTGKHIGVLIIDSRVTPLRMGTTGIALGLAGFEPIRDYRTEKDLYGRSISVTTHAVADDLASAAHLMMGESREQIPAVLIRNAPVAFSKADGSALVIPRENCLFASHFEPESI
jgi:coenzyme F420-0:L-glutamate ligase